MKTCKRNHEYESHLRQCPMCRAESNNRWYQANKDSVAEYQKKWSETNKNRIAGCKRQYYQTNKEKVSEYNKQYRKQYQKKRRETDVLFKLNNTISTLIRKSFKRQCWRKSSKSQQILGCDLNTLQAHLIQTAKNNYGGKYFPSRKYEIDHITPVSSATTEEELIKLNHYTNLQLLYPKDNREKGDKLDWALKR